MPGTRLVGDIARLRTGEGWLYLATVIDLFSGMVIGWSMAVHMRACLCTAALQTAHSSGSLRGPAKLSPNSNGCFGRLNTPSTPPRNFSNGA